MDGPTCCRGIRELERSGELPGHLPVIGTSASAMHHHIDELMATGYDDIPTKPLGLQRMVSTIRHHVHPL